jgi:hypothetical protein
VEEVVAVVGTAADLTSVAGPALEAVQRGVPYLAAYYARIAVQTAARNSS